VIRPNKYRARKASCGAGHTHDSRAEARRCDELRLLAKCGEIEALTFQPVFHFTVDGRQVKHPNGRRACFTPDFQYRERGGKLVCEDVKGVRTEGYVTRLAFFRAFYPYIELREIKR